MLYSEKEQILDVGEVRIGARLEKWKSARGESSYEHTDTFFLKNAFSGLFVLWTLKSRKMQKRKIFLKIRRCSLCLKEHFLIFLNNFHNRSFGSSQSKYPGTMLNLITRVHLFVVGRLCLPHLP